MKILQKASGRDFVVLNLTDPQLGNKDWKPEHTNRKILEYTVSELIRRVQPDLITVSGDLSYAGSDLAYDMLADFLNGFGIPWAPVWGNHDNQGGSAYISGVGERYQAQSHCLYEAGDPALGNGNYILSIEENQKPIAAIFMLDSHDRDPYCDADGNSQSVWARLTDAQGEWIAEQCAQLRELGYADATIVCHIPIYGYRKASAAAYRPEIAHDTLTPEMADGEACWNAGYTDSIGVQYEGICSYPEEDGMLEAFQATGLIHQMVAGHDHVNNWIIRYGGIRMVYALKCGAGCYWNRNLNGGTVLRIGENGVNAIYHEYVDVSAFL